MAVAVELPDLLLPMPIRARRPAPLTRTGSSARPTQTPMAHDEALSAVAISRTPMLPSLAQMTHLVVYQSSTEVSSDRHLFFDKSLTFVLLGTYVRTVAIDRLIENFINARPEQIVQIISLGAGTDTRFFRYLDRGHADQIMYHEIDFPVISKNKLAHIRASQMLSHPGTGFYELHGAEAQDINPETTKWGYYADDTKRTGYMFHPMDLRRLPDEINGIRRDVPTVIVSECCLCYLAKEEADKVLSYFTKRIPTIGIILYEPTNPTDSFGRMMTANLASRRLAMPSIHAYSSLDAQMDRLKDLGFEMFQEGASIDWLWMNWIMDDEKFRLSRLQMFDEEEEWKMLASHYLVCWAVREGREDDAAFEGWDGLEGEEERRIRETDEE